MFRYSNVRYSVLIFEDELLFFVGLQKGLFRTVLRLWYCKNAIEKLVGRYVGGITSNFMDCIQQITSAT